MDVYLIVCHTQNRVIGKDGAMPWHLPEDLKRFKRITLQHPVMVMGRKTFEALPGQRPLPGRQNIVLSRSKPALQGCCVIASPDDIAQCTDSDCCFVIGGAQIYRIFLPQAKRIYRTVLDTEMQGDTFFPQLNEHEWQLIESQECESQQPFAVRFEVLERI